MRIDLTAWSEQVEDLPAEVATALTRSGMVDVRVAEPPTRWRVVTDSRVGVLTVAGWEVRVKPKLGIPRLMFLLGYAADPRGWRELGPLFDVEDHLFSAIAHGFALQAERALSPAPLRGYVAVDERELTLRGRVRIGDQLARRPGLPIPLELTYDDHIADVPENRLVRGAAELLLRMPQIPKPVRLRLLRVRATLEDVEPARPSPSIRAPEITRLNVRYAGALALAELILRGTSLTTSRGQVASAAFVFDMNKVFEDFLSTALRVALERHGGRVRFQYSARHLDDAGRLTLKPDITWWHKGVCHAVIDAKYKALAVSAIPNADAYQMLAYCIAFGLESGYLVYAKDAGQKPLDHVVRGAGTRIRVRAIDVEREPAEVLSEIDALAAEIASLRISPTGSSKPIGSPSATSPM
jgi:5-methylcytosine-specific restriction enzyme subunit McrC